MAKSKKKRPASAKAVNSGPPGWHGHLIAGLAGAALAVM